MFKPSQIPEPSLKDIKDIIAKGTTHANYTKTVRRARLMNAWYGATEGFDGDNDLKREIIRKSPVESNDDYDYRLKNFDILPFEHKFIQGQQRIYDDSNVSRSYDNEEFWKEKEKYFDDCGDDITTFFEDKVLPVHEVQGFGGIGLDIATDLKGETISVDGKAVPYPYVIQAHELQYYETWYGHLTLVVTRVKKGDSEEYRALTPKHIYVFKTKDATPVVIKHQFGETPFVIIKGAPDIESGFKVGLPRRFAVSGVYQLVCELLYDLKMATLYFGHPVPYMHVDDLKAIAGVLDSEGKVDNNKVRAKVGRVGVYSGDEPPKDLFLQAEMNGLQHISETIFEKLIPLIYQMVSVRDKSKVVHNASGRSKQFDSVEEQALLSQTASDLEKVEKAVFRLMYKVRGEKGEPTIIYNKHHDLRTADEVFTQFTELLQYGKTTDNRVLAPTEMIKFMILDYVNKLNVPEETKGKIKNELTNFYESIKIEPIDPVDPIDPKDGEGAINPKVIQE